MLMVGSKAQNVINNILGKIVKYLSRSLLPLLLMSQVVAKRLEEVPFLSVYARLGRKENLTR